MSEVAALPKNGFKAISTFSGCGGSSLGYKMAGFDVLWANEFIPAAQDTYRANHPSTILDVQDVRKVDPKAILKAIGMKAGQLDLLDGSPPCAAFSTAGKREAGWGVEKKYSDAKQRVDDLFFEFARILKGVRPKCFVAENVAGLVKGTAKGYFKMILTELRACGYRVEARVLDAQWLGVPQQRNRLIFVGAHEDLGIEPAFPSPLPYRYSIRDACPWISGGSFTTGFNSGSKIDVNKPSPVVMAMGISGSSSQLLVVANAHNEYLEIGDPSWKKANGAGWSRGEQRSLDHPAPTVQASESVIGGSPAKLVLSGEQRKFTIAELRRICSFPDDFILTGSYAQQWERLGRAVPPVMMSHVAAVVRDRMLLRCAE